MVYHLPRKLKTLGLVSSTRRVLSVDKTEIIARKKEEVIERHFPFLKF